MKIIDVIWFRPNEFQNIAFESTYAFGFSHLRFHIVPLFYSGEEKRVFKKLHVLSEVGEDFLSFEENIWCLVRRLVEKDISVTGC